MTPQETIRKLCENGFGTLRTDYSGRFMFGRKCMGIVTEDPHALMARCSDIGPPLSSYRTDSMGLDTIVYWPSIQDN